MKSGAAAAAILGLGAALLYTRRASAGVPTAPRIGPQLPPDFTLEPEYPTFDDPFIYRAPEVEIDLPTLNLPDLFNRPGGAILNFGPNESAPTFRGSRFCSFGGVNLIKHFERFSPVRYDAGDGLETIGYGHVVVAGERIPQRISESDAQRLLELDIAEKCDAEVNAIGANINQQQTDALYSLIFNIGAGAFRRSKTKAAIERGDLNATVAEWMGFKFSGGRVLPGLEKRRTIETQLYVGGIDILVAQELADEIFA